MPNVPPVESDQLPTEYRYLLSDNDLGELSLFKTIANNPPILQSYMKWGSTLWEESGLKPEEVEVVILTIAKELRSQYEWHHHVQLARELGLEDETIKAIFEGNYENLTNTQHLLSVYAQDFLDSSVSQNLCETISDNWNDKTVVGLTCLCSHYLATARIIEALDVQPDTEFSDWEFETTR